MLAYDELYSWVKDLPVVDWHNHLDLNWIAADQPLGSLYEVWVKADPYKHRAMRICGEREELITGDVAATEVRGHRGRGLNGQECPFPGGGMNGQECPFPDGASNGQECPFPGGGMNGQECPFPGDGQTSARQRRGYLFGERTLLSVQEADRWAAWMRTLPKLVGNPIFAWAKQELEFLGLDPIPYLRGEGVNISLADWTPSRLLKAFKVDVICPCTTVDSLRAYLARSGVSNGHASSSSGERTLLSVLSPESGVPPSGERTLLSVHPFREFSIPQASASAHFSHSLRGGVYHERNLPHIIHDGALVFLTFRLADSLPQALLQELELSKREWIEHHPRPWTEETEAEYERMFGGQVEKWLDNGHGACLLRKPECRRAVVDCLERFNETGDGKGLYALHAYVVMPNHVHVVFEVKRAADFESIIKSWKGVSARRINQIQGTKGQVWQEEYFDRLVRDADHYGRTLRYVRRNAEQAYGGETARGGMNGQECPFSEGMFSEGMLRTDKSVRSPVEFRTDRSVRSTSGALLERNMGNGHSCPFLMSRVEARSLGNGHSCPFRRQEADSPILIPSLRMNAGEVVALDALETFQAAGCRVVDISVDNEDDLDRHYDSLAVVACFAARHGWTMLLHLGALRETSARLKSAAGPAGGYAGMRAPMNPEKVAKFLNRLEERDVNGQECPFPGGAPNGQECPFPGGGSNGQECPFPSGGSNGQECPFPREGTSGGLPRTILLSLNPEAHAQLAVLAGSFNEAGKPGKVQLGPAWWWCDHQEGILDVLEKNAAYGVLSTFVGMTTDSRSLLSFVRHDYFRRILCRWVAEKIAAGDFPDDAMLIRPILENICYRNSKALVTAV